MPRRILIKVQDGTIPFPREEMLALDRVPEEYECPIVQHLTFRKPGLVTEDVLCGILIKCIRLESLILSGIEDLSDRALATIAEACPKLTGLNVNGCKRITDTGIMLVVASLPLQWLHLNGATGLTDASVQAIVKSCPRLVELELSALPLLTANAVQDIWQYSRSLRSLRLAKCRNLYDRAFPSSPSGPSSTGSPSRNQGNRSPQHTPTMWLDRISPLILRHSAENLRVLDLRECSKLTDMAIKGIVQHAPRIQSLTLSGCSLLTDEALKTISLLGEHLDILAMANVPLVTDAGIVWICRACVNLRGVDISFCELLTDMSIFELASGPKNLRRLSAIGVTRLTDNAIYHLAEHSELERLYLSYCEGISMEAVHFLLKKQTRLQHLSATGVPSVSKRKGVQRFSDNPPQGYDSEQQKEYSVFSGGNVGSLRQFLDKEELRRRRCDAANILFQEFSDDDTKLY